MGGALRVRGASRGVPDEERGERDGVRPVAVLRDVRGGAVVAAPLSEAQEGADDENARVELGE